MRTLLLGSQILSPKLIGESRNFVTQAHLESEKVVVQAVGVKNLVAITRKY
jgi:hypothetical protein